MFVVWALLGGFLVWTLLGAWIGLNVARWNGFPVAIGIIRGMLLGPLALAMFGGIGENKLDRGDGNRILVNDKTEPSRYAPRRCPECTGPNDFLIWVMAIVHEACGDFVAPQTTFVHYYRCVVCNYDWQLTSPLADPDKPVPKRVF